MLVVVALIAAIITFTMFTWARKNGKKPESLAALGICIISLAVGAFQFVTVIPAGTVGVIDLFGTVSDTTLKPGINIVNPLARIIKYSFKTQEAKEVMEVPSKEGSIIKLEISLLFKINPSMANKIYKEVEGGDYQNVILAPQFRSVVREVTARYEAKALYTDARKNLANDVETELQKKVESWGIVITSAPLRQIVLPARLTQSIDEKLQAEQESQRMSFILDKERKEAERKRIEAKGIADFQTIVAKGISNQYLKWKGIEATEKLSSSPNAKIVVIGSGKDGLPIILGGNN